MSEVYPLRAPGEYAGSLCEINKPNTCKNYARFCVSAIQNGARKSNLSCGHHLAVIVKGLWITDGKAVVVQEIPGNWFQGGQSLAAINGDIVRTLSPRGNGH